jgi:GntR family transcriptional repressor for pyruvate dehydrogenase complex
MAWETIKQLKRKTLHEEVMENILGSIEDESLRKGEQMPSEHELAHRFGVGRSTIREVLRVLDALGIIERTKKGSFISEKPSMVKQFRAYTNLLKDCKIFDLLEFRSLLEGEISSLAASRATEEDLERIKTALDDMESAFNGNANEKYIEADAAYHLAVAESTNNQVTERILGFIQAEVKEEIAEVIAKCPDLIGRGLEKHKEIYNAIRDENAKKAKVVMLEHINDIMQSIQKPVGGN